MKTLHSIPQEGSGSTIPEEVKLAIRRYYAYFEKVLKYNTSNEYLYFYNTDDRNMPLNTWIQMENRTGMWLVGTHRTEPPEFNPSMVEIVTHVA